MISGDNYDKDDDVIEKSHQIKDEDTLLFDFVAFSLPYNSAFSIQSI